MGFISDVIFLNKRKVFEKPKINLFTNNFKPYSSSSNKNGILYSSYAVGDEENKTITHNATSFSNSSAYIFEGFTPQKQYIYSASINGDIEHTFLKVRCLGSGDVVLYNSYEIIGTTEIIFTVPDNTMKIQIFVGTASGHTGSTIFGDISIFEV